MSVLVGKNAPDFDVKAVVNGTEIVPSYTLGSLKGKYVVLFFYPKDFTFVCPTELHAFEEKREEFEKRGVQLIGCSVDSEYSHFAWLAMEKAKGGIQGVKYPILADFNKTIARAYDVLDEASGAAYRGLFLIDKKGVVRHQVVNDMPLGRSVDEALRIIDALQFNETNGEVCPANWRAGDKALKANAQGIQDFFKN